MLDAVQTRVQAEADYLIATARSKDPSHGISLRTMSEGARKTAAQIFETVTRSAREELARSTPALFFSGLVGGICMGLTGLGVALTLSYLGERPAAQFIAFFFYPVGFIVVIIGRAQLFTENTLYPVVLVLDERRHVFHTLRLWTAVLASNVLGAVFFGWLVMKTGALPANFADSLAGLGLHAAEGHFTLIFAKAVIGGWLIALVAWMVNAGDSIIGQIAIIWLLAFIVGAGHFSHCIASSAEITAAVMAGHLRFINYVQWLVPCTLGNIVGGVAIVSLLNYGQVRLGSDRPQAGDR